MSNNIRTSILISGVCALALALLYAPKLIFSEPQTYIQHANNAIVRSSVDNESAKSVSEEITIIPEKPEEDTPAEIQEEPAVPREEVLGRLAENLKVAREELIVMEEAFKKRLSQDELYAIASMRIVNLFCELEDNQVAIATGVVIHENGYILTNAHVADAAQPKPCLIRKGSPARNFAIAERIFSSPGFTKEKQTRESLAQDIALWKITETLDAKNASPFPAFTLLPAKLPADNKPLATFSYPAELLGSQTIVTSLYLSFSETTVVSHDAYFIESTQSLGSQKGSSGGVLVDPYTGEFTGLIFAVASENSSSIAERTLFSLTPFAVTEAVRAATGLDLQTYLDANP